MYKLCSIRLLLLKYLGSNFAFCLKEVLSSASECHCSYESGKFVSFL